MGTFICFFDYFVLEQREEHRDEVGGRGKSIEREHSVDGAAIEEHGDEHRKAERAWEDGRA